MWLDEDDGALSCCPCPPRCCSSSPVTVGVDALLDDGCCDVFRTSRLFASSSQSESMHQHIVSVKSLHI